MSDKYIIKNCECKVKGKTTLCVRDVPYKKCENITDCKLKQIVKQAGYCLCPEILELLDIQEVE